MAAQHTYEVPDIHCDACSATITRALEPLAGVGRVEVDLSAKRVVVSGDALDDSSIREAIVAAGFELG